VGLESCGLLDQFLGQAPQFCVGFGLTRVAGDAEKAGQYADDIAVEDGPGLVEGDARDGAGRIAPDAGQFEDIFKSVWEFSVMALDDSLRRFVHVPDSSVITKPLP
jgi:hypothetical protein